MKQLVVIQRHGSSCHSGHEDFCKAARERALTLDDSAVPGAVAVAVSNDARLHKGAVPCHRYGPHVVVAQMEVPLQSVQPSQRNDSMLRQWENLSKPVCRTCKMAVHVPSLLTLVCDKWRSNGALQQQGLTENQSAMLGCCSTSCMKSRALLEWFRKAQRFFTCTLCTSTAK